MKNKFYLLLGLIWGLVGIRIIIAPVIQREDIGYTFDFTGIKWAFGLFLIALGGLFVWSVYRKKATANADKMKKDHNYFMCKRCKAPYIKKDVPELKCLTCNADLEPLEGFYDRYPDLRNEKRP